MGTTKADWGQTWRSLALRTGLGLTCAELGLVGSNLGPTWAQCGHVWTQVGLNVRNLALCGGICRGSWAQDRPNVGNMGTHESPTKMEIAVKKCKNASFQRLALGPQNWPGLGPTWAPALGRNCSEMYPTYGQVAPCWSQVVPKLESEPSGRKLGPCWPKLTPSRANVAAMSDRNGAFGRFCADLQNV